MTLAHAHDAFTAIRGEMEPPMNRHIACLLKHTVKLSDFLHGHTITCKGKVPQGVIMRHSNTPPLTYCNALLALTVAMCFALSTAQAQDGPCCSAHDGKGCMSQDCNDTVCQLDPFCCSMSWDERCALEASVLCQACRATNACEVPIADIDELTPCDFGLPLDCTTIQNIRPLIPGLKLGGRAWSSETSRDVDWFEISLDEPQMLRIELWTQGSIGLAIVDDQCPPTTLAEGVDGCSSITQTCVPAGVTRITVRSLLFENISCEDDRARYTIQAALTPCTLTRLVNDRCDMALPIGVGQIFTDTTNATTEPSWLPSSCDEGAGLAFTHDAWFRFTANASGIFQASTCVAPTFDSRLAVYADCGGDLLACSDDSCDGVGSSAEFQMYCGATALIRIGGWGSGGPITLSIDPIFTVSCSCPADLDNSGEVDTSDVALCLLDMGNIGGSSDIDQDGEVSTGDLSIILISTGRCDS